MKDPFWIFIAPAFALLTIITVLLVGVTVDGRYSKFERACHEVIGGRVVDTGTHVVCINNDRVVFTR